MTRKEYDFFSLYERFLNETRNGKRLQKSGKRITKGTIRSYEMLLHYLKKFSVEKQFDMRVVPGTRLGRREFKRELKHWKNFYDRFTAFMYEDENCYDNFVGRYMKLLRVFFNYLNDEKGMGTGPFCKKFYAHYEDINIVVLSPERLNFLIHNKEFEESLRPVLRRAKDILVLGCTVALRVSDLMGLTRANLEKINERVYLCVHSQKNHTFTRVKLPQYAIDITEKDNRRKTLLPYMHNVFINKYIKRVAEQAGWTETVIRTRQKRGISFTIYKNPEKKTHYRFCDSVTSHTMRRTAVTTMLLLGMDEQLVRKVSGHSQGSKEFYKYVSYAQTYMDDELDKMHEKLNERRLKVA
jgi:integrase